jgi:hypothetical protein
MTFDPAAYGAEVAHILSLDGDGARRMPLASGRCSSAEARRLLRSASAAELFPSAAHPDAALAGLWLYFSCLDESHGISQSVESAEGSFWHGIMHRQEPDAWNSGYWFRRAGRHAIFPALARAAGELAARHPEARFTPADPWDPFAFIDYCEKARHQPGSPAESLALDIQLAEWQLLFDWCAARPR